MTEMAQRVVKESYNTAGCVVVGVICMLMGMIFLVVLGVREVRPFLNDFRLETVQCKVFSSGYTDMKRRCTYHNFFHSSYPCFQIRVSYFAGRKQQTGYLYQSVHEDKNKCCIQPCSSIADLNSYYVKVFEEKYGHYGDSFPCYVNPKSPDELFVFHADKSYDRSIILYCILWPSLGVFLLAYMLFIVCCRVKGLCCYTKSGSSVSYQAI